MIFCRPDTLFLKKMQFSAGTGQRMKTAYIWEYGKTTPPPPLCPPCLVQFDICQAFSLSFFLFFKKTAKHWLWESMCSQTNPKKVHPNLAIVIVSAVLRPEEGLWCVCLCVRVCGLLNGLNTIYIKFSACKRMYVLVSSVSLWAGWMRTRMLFGGKSVQIN